MAESTYRPSAEIIAIFRRYVEGVIEAGLWSLPEGMTVGDVVASTQWTDGRPSGKAAPCRDADLPAVGSFV